MIYDQDIREPLFDFLEMQYRKCRILEEMNIGKSRADVIMVCEDGIIGLEIKSDADSYTRLSGQVKDYDKYFDRNYVVVGTKHAQHIREHVPEWWGIITVELIGQLNKEQAGKEQAGPDRADNNRTENDRSGNDRTENDRAGNDRTGNELTDNGQTISVLDFYILRKPQANPLVTWEKKLELLWKPELARIQEAFQMPKYKEKRRTFVAGKIAERAAAGKIDKQQLQKKYCDLLFERDYTLAEEVLAEYRKGEIQKVLENETDPQKQLELKMEQQARKLQLKSRSHFPRSFS